VLGLVLRRLPKHVREAVAAGGVVVTGGNALFAGGSQGWISRLDCLRCAHFIVQSGPEVNTWCCWRMGGLR
jgi:hypothetical protein